MTARDLAALAATTITESYGDHLPDTKTSQGTDHLATKLQSILVDISTADESQWRLITRALTNEMRIYVPVVLRSGGTSIFHNNPQSDYYGARKTAELV